MIGLFYARKRVTVYFYFNGRVQFEAHITFFKSSGHLATLRHLKLSRSIKSTSTNNSIIFSQLGEKVTDLIGSLTEECSMWKRER